LLKTRGGPGPCGPPLSYAHEYGAYHFEGNAYIEAVFIFLIPIAVTIMLTIALNVHPAIKIFQVHKKIERETSLE